jgi:tetratricopeptide (TPR) repeat protein
MPRAAADPGRLFDDALRAHRAGRLDHAARLYRRLLAADPQHWDSLHLLGVIAQQSGRPADALGFITQAIAGNGKVALYHCNRGVALAALGRFEEAAASYRAALALDPQSAEAFYNLGNALGELGRLADAAAAYREALALRPDYWQALTRLGTVLQEQRQTEAAVECFRRAIALQPNVAHLHANLAGALREQGKFAESASACRVALALDPDLPAAHYHLAMALLPLGEFAAGWAEYEWRWHLPELRPFRRNFPQPQWQGEPAAGRTLLLHAEQGYGDTLQFCRYALPAAAAGLRVILAVPPPLVRLLRTLPRVAEVVALGERLPAFDLHCPLLSLPLAMRTTLATIPSAVAYLRADADDAAAIGARLAGLLGPGLRVGLAWAGNPRRHARMASATDRRRSIDPELLAPLFAVAGVQFVSLQKDGPAAPAHLPLLDLMPQMQDFADTAALIANLDLVIAVDTAVVHLAAALGKPVWLLDRHDPCWRWLLGRRDSPWYPTLRIYRQPSPGDWARVLAEAAQDLRRRAGHSA